MKKYVIGIIIVSVIGISALTFLNSKSDGALQPQKKLSYHYSTDIWAKVSLRNDGPYNADLELYPAGENGRGKQVLATVEFPEKLIKKELAPLLGTEKCFNVNTEKNTVCRAISQHGIAITLYPESYESLAKKFDDEICRWENCSAAVTVGGRTGKIFTQQVELEGRSFYLLPMDEKSTLVALVDYNGNDKEYTDFTAAQLNAIVASATLE